jgi:hypothetical protein
MITRSIKVPAVFKVFALDGFNSPAADAISATTLHALQGTSFRSARELPVAKVFTLNGSNSPAVISPAVVWMSKLIVDSLQGTSFRSARAVPVANVRTLNGSHLPAATEHSMPSAQSLQGSGSRLTKAMAISDDLPLNGSNSPAVIEAAIPISLPLQGSTGFKVCELDRSACAQPDPPRCPCQYRWAHQFPFNRRSTDNHRVRTLNGLISPIATGAPTPRHVALQGSKSADCQTSDDSHLTIAVGSNVLALAAWRESS